MTLKDKLGKRIKNGSTIVYAQRSGNSGDLRVGIVKNIIDSNDDITIQVRGISPEGELNSKDGYLQYTNRVVVIEQLPSKLIRRLRNHYYDSKRSIRNK